MAETTDLLHVNGHTFDLDDLTYKERREIKLIARNEIWDEDLDGPFENLNEDDLMPAIIVVFMRRHDPKYTLEQAGDLKVTDVFPEPASNGGPPTQRAANEPATVPSSTVKTRSTRSSTPPKKTPVASGSPSSQ